MNIAIAGKMKSGKSTLAQELQNVDLCSSILSFAGPIRDALGEMGITKEEHPEMYREGAQWIGTDFVRRYDTDWWVNLLCEKVTYNTWYSDPNVTVIVDDCRFENEFRALKELGFLTVWLDVSEATQLARGAESGRLSHASETGLDHIVKEEWDLWLPEWTSVEQRLVAIREARTNYHLIQTCNSPTVSA